jgi:hypothetical protein
VNPWFLAFTAFVGLNLFQFGFSNMCPMGYVLRKLGVPDNKPVEHQALATASESV